MIYPAPSITLRSFVIGINGFYSLPFLFSAPKEGAWIYFAFFIFFLLIMALAINMAVLVDIAIISHDFTTTKQAVIQVSKILKQYNKEKGVLYDLGSCRGDFLLGLIKNCPELQGFGVDNSNFRVRLSRMKAFLFRRQVIFSQGNLFTADITNADVVYVFLGKPALPVLENKFKKELKPGAIVITSTEYLPSWPVSETVVVHPKKPEFEQLFVYEKV